MGEEILHRTGDSLRSLIELWDIVSNTFGITIANAANFVEQKCKAYKFTLWVDEEHTGLWVPAINSDLYVLNVWNSGQDCKLVTTS